MSVPYELLSVNLPPMSGSLLQVAAEVLSHPLGRWVARRRLEADTNLDALRSFEGSGPPMAAPRFTTDTLERRSETPWKPLEALLARSEAGRLHLAYQQGLDPTDVAERVLAAIEEDDAREDGLRAFIATDPDEVRALAAASRERYRNGEPLGPLDGVPVAVKDELDQAGFPTTIGRAFEVPPAKQDATLVARLRQAGAVLVGKTNMHEIGINPNGVNSTFGQVRNPHDRSRDSGGSSSGSAAAVAAGLVPIALGADGGGSIRIPAALCGVVGLKGTYGRFSEQGVAPLCPSVGHVGPIGRSVVDVALAYALTGGYDPADPGTHGQPAVDVAGLDAGSPLRIGIFRPWFEHATGPAVSAARRAVDTLVASGARIVDIELRHLEEARVAHAVSILSEMKAAVRRAGFPRRGYASSTRLSLGIADLLTPFDLLQAQLVRAALFREFEAAFEAVDIIATPTTAASAPPIIGKGDLHAWTSIHDTVEMMRFAFASNLTGHPALTVPVGEEQGRPLGVQLIGPAFSERTLLAAGLVLEAAHPPVAAPGRLELV